MICTYLHMVISDLVQQQPAIMTMTSCASLLVQSFLLASTSALYDRANDNNHRVVSGLCRSWFVVNKPPHHKAAIVAIFD